MAYSKVLHVHHGGRVVSSSSGVEFADMTEQVIFFPHSPSLSEVVVKVKAMLGWTDIGDEVVLEGRYDAGGCRAYTQMIPINVEDEWETYKELVDSSQIKSLVVVAVKVTGRANLLIELNKRPSILKICNDDHGGDTYDAGPSQPFVWETEMQHNEDILEEIMEEK